jgi:putative MATE family efflux protein
MTNPAATIDEQFSTKNIGKLICQFSIPSIIGALVLAFYNVMVRIFVGQGIGPLAISGLALAFPFMILLIAFATLIGAGAASRISIALGENNKEKAEKILGNAFILTFIITGSVSVVSYIFMHNLLHFFAGTAKTIQYAEDLMRVIIPGSIFSALTAVFNTIMRSAGYPRKAMFTLIISAILNMALTPLFIFVFHWGIQSVAIAVNIAYFVCSVWVLAHFMDKKSNIRFYKKNFSLDKSTVFSIISIGLAPFSVQLATSFVMILINTTLIKYGGDLAIGAYTTISSLNILIVMFVIGLNLGTQPIIGFNYGAKLYGRMFVTLKYASIIATVFTCIGFILGTFYPTYIVSLFSNDVKFQAIAAKALQISVFMFPIKGLQIVLTNFIQSVGKAKLSIFISFTYEFLFLIPALLFLPPVFGLNGVWAALPFSDGLAAIITGVSFYYFYRKFKANNKEIPTIDNQ